VAGATEDDALGQQLMRAAREAPMVVRVGVHGGTAHVGNMGCDRRLSYTAVGDVVNTASRLEGFVKYVQGPCEVVAGTCVVRDAHPALLTRLIGPVRLAGKAEPVSVCQVLGVADCAHETPGAGADERPAAETLAVATFAAALNECGSADGYVHDAAALTPLRAFNDAAAFYHATAAKVGITLTTTESHTACRARSSSSDIDAISTIELDVQSWAPAAARLTALYRMLPPALQSRFTPETSWRCLESGTGVIETDGKK
jgi:hypothetical protein